MTTERDNTMTTETETQQLYEALLVKAYERGKSRANLEREARNVPETYRKLGDLVKEAERLNGMPDNGGRMYRDIRDNYQTGYYDGQEN
jgi:hypothetical protein